MEIILSEIGELMLADRLSEALGRVEIALEGFEQAGDLRGQAICLTLLGTLDRGANDTSVERLERALSLLEEVQDGFPAAAVARHLGIIYTHTGQHDRAEGHLRRSLGHLQGFQRSGSQIPAAEYWVYASLLDLPADLSMLSDPFSPETRQALVRQAEGAIRNSLGSILTWADRFEKADAELEQALALTPSSEKEAVERILENLAVLRQRQGRHDEARGILEDLLAAALETRLRVQRFKALDAFETWSGDLEGALERNGTALESARERGDALAVAMLLRGRAKFLEESGNLQQAQALYERAREEASASGERYAEAQALLGLAILSLNAGSPEVAVSSLERAIPYFQSAGDRLSELTARQILIAGYLGLGAYARAESAIREAEELGRTMYYPAGNDIVRALAKINRLRADGLPGEWSLGEIDRLFRTTLEDPVLGTMVGRAGASMFAALRLLEEAAPPEKIVKALEATLELARAEGAVRAEAQGRVFLGYVLRLQGATERVRPEWQKALELARSRDLHDLEAQILGGLARVAWDEGRRYDAVALALDSVDAFERTVAEVRTDALLTTFLGGNVKIYTLAISGLIETGRFSEAFEYSERARSRALLHLVGNQRLQAGGGDQPGVVAEIEAARTRLHQIESQESETARPSRELIEARQGFEDLLVRSQLLAPGYTNLVRVAPLDLRDLQIEVLDEETTLISFFLLGDRVVAWIVDHERVVFRPTALLEADLELVPCFSDELGQGPSRRGVEPLAPCGTEEDLSTELYRKLMEPVMPVVRNPRLVLIPHDALHRLPFSALRNPRTGRYLIEDYTMTIAPSASTLGVLRRQGSPWAGRALVVGDPELPPGDLGRLPGARREAEVVAAILGTKPLLGAEATETRVRAGGDGVDVVHLAAHGVYEARQPLFSHIALAADEKHDGRLEMHEIFGEVDLSEVNLVVLSACGTALGERTGGDEIVGLVRAFLHAGSPAVLATLWSIDDDASSTLMAGFYRRLLAGEPAAEALRQAQLETLRRRETASPYYWAGFHLIGDAGSLQNPSGR